MIRKSEYFELTDRYINSELSLPEISLFEAQLENDTDLNEELNLHLDVEMALAEQDIISLRNSLNQIVQNYSETSAENMTVIDSFRFNLADESASANNFNRLNTENISNFGSSFPKIHLYQHKIAGKENIHQFYKEQSEDNTAANEQDQFNPMDEQIFEDVQLALEESDINELRANLKQVAQSIPAHNFSTEDIDNYISNLMEPDRKAIFEQELTVNSFLANEVQLIREINLAAAETDIMELRANLNTIQHTELHAAASIEDLENYINNELSEERVASFEAQLSSDYKLQQEIELIKNINSALAEDDVMRLRNNLQNIAAQAAQTRQNERSFPGKINLRKIISSTVAASIIILLGITGFMAQKHHKADVYQQYYSLYGAPGNARSANINDNTVFAMALQKYENKDFDAALELFAKVTANEPYNMAGHFYYGISMQEKGKYLNAIKQYQTVIENNDNLFTEQAQWYTGLCLLQTNENKKAYRQFKKLADSNGFYQDKARDILKKIKFSD